MMDCEFILGYDCFMIILYLSFGFWFVVIGFLLKFSVLVMLLFLLFISFLCSFFICCCSFLMYLIVLFSIDVWFIFM